MYNELNINITTITQSLFNLSVDFCPFPLPAQLIHYCVKKSLWFHMSPSAPMYDTSVACWAFPPHVPLILIVLEMSMCSHFSSPHLCMAHPLSIARSLSLHNLLVGCYKMVVISSNCFPTHALCAFSNGIRSLVIILKQIFLHVANLPYISTWHHHGKMMDGWILMGLKYFWIRVLGVNHVFCISPVVLVMLLYYHSWIQSHGTWGWLVSCKNYKIQR